VKFRYLFLYLLIFEWFLIHDVPTVYFGDCGEILAAIYTGGIPHPMGFPLYLLLSTLIAKLCSLTFYVNVVSSLAGTLDAFLFIEVYRELRKKYFSTELSLPLWIIGILIFLSSSTLLLHSSSARTYSLNLLCVLLILYWFLKNQVLSRIHAWTLGFLLGLGIDSHFLFIMVFPALIIGYWPQKKNFLFKLPWVFSGFCLAASLYIWIPLRSHFHPSVNWDHSDNFAALFDYMTQKDYQIKFVARDFQNVASYFQFLLGCIWNERPVPFLLLSIIGAGFSFTRNKRYFWIVFSVILSNILILFFYGNETDLRIAYRFFLPLHSTMALWAPLGLEWLLVKTKMKKKEVEKSISWLLAFLSMILFINFQAKWRGLNQATFSYDFAVNYLKSIPTGATVEIQGDNELFPIAYTMYVCHLRPDIKIIDWSGTLFPETVRRLKENPSLKPSDIQKQAFDASSGQLYLAIDPGASSSMQVEPYGLCYRLTALADEKKWPFPSDPEEVLCFRHFGIYLPDTEGEETEAEYPLMEGSYLMAKGDSERAMEKLREAETIGVNTVHTLNNLAQLYSKTDHLDDAEVDLKRSLQLQPHLFTAYLNLGVLYGKEGRYKEALPILQKAIELQPQNSAANFYFQKVSSLLMVQPN
jgi:tetratricopeptide (TPR) repeat protein